jgi:choline dehydrogenase-like flavoprotein
MSFLNVRQKETLKLICDTFVPTLQCETGEDERVFRYCASELGVPGQVEIALEKASSDAQLSQLKTFLRLLEMRPVNGLTVRIWKSFSEMTLDERTATLYWWASSPLMMARTAFQGFKRTILAIFYAMMPDGAANPTWEGVCYPGPPALSSDIPHKITPLVVSDSVLKTDVLIIGSGAGGGVVAGELSAAGYEVMVVDKGGYYAEPDFHGREMESSQRLFEKEGLLTTADTSMSVLAGSTLGGGTTINWSASFRTPDNVLEEWAHDYGFSGATSADYQRSLDAVTLRVNVGTAESIPNRNNAMLEKGCKALCYHTDVIPRNVIGCEECGYCGYGCPFGAKQGTLKTYLQDAFQRGARIVVNAHVNHILIRNGIADGAELTLRDADGGSRQITVRARVVVVSAGTIHTPAILIRSGLGNGNIGANLHLHPVTVTFGVYDEPVEIWQGVPMSRFSRQFANLDGRGYGVTLECAPAHPGISAAALPWISGRAHKQLMQKLHRMSNIIVLTRDYYGGQVKVDKQGNPVLHYKVHPYDARHLMRGMLESLRIHRAAGAKELCSPHNAQMLFREGKDGDFETYLQRVEAAGFRGNAYALFSAHQMSTCRIGGDTARGAIDPSGETYEVKNLFVADGSVMPTATGVNPMISIMGVSHYIAQQIKAKL